jgi:cellulose synthase/poly-beta-1,6-N-acetylglucosamine synthase-like glycosyltransferase
MPLLLLSLFILISLLVSNVFRYVLAGLLRMSSKGLLKDYSFQPTVSILLPCFNEGKTVYETVESICKSNYPNDKFEIIARDDCSKDDSYEWLLKAKQDFTNIPISVSRNEENAGKAHTVFKALQQSSAEIILSIDSDCIFSPNAIRELVSCFADPKIGGVGGVIGVRNVNENLATQCQTFVYYICFHFLKSLETCTKTVTCISGCMFAVRRDLMVKLEPKVLARNWFGISVNDGEDRFLTHQILLEGYGTVINTDAQCLTTVPNNMKTLFKQQIRWQRSGVRDFFITLKNIKQHVFKIHPNALFSQLVPTLMALASVTAVLVIQQGTMPFAIVPAALGFYVALIAAFHAFTCKYNPEQKINNPLSVMAIAVWIFAGRLIETLAVFTLDSRDWGTRTKVTPTQPTAEPSNPAPRVRPFPAPVPVPSFAAFSFEPSAASSLSTGLRSIAQASLLAAGIAANRGS